jgi:hypothetical protein
MPRPRPLGPGEAASTLAHRLGARLGPRLFQFNTKFGIRPYRVFLVWSRWTGEDRGEGNETICHRIEIIPTPKLDVSGVRYVGSPIGRLPDGTVNVSEITVNYTADQLSGLVFPREHEDILPEPNDFYYEVVEDDRGDPAPQRAKYRLASQPMRDAAMVMWRVTLERMSEDNLRNGRSPYAPGRNVVPSPRVLPAHRKDWEDDE